MISEEEFTAERLRRWLKKKYRKEGTTVEVYKMGLAEGASEGLLEDYDF